MADSAGRLSGTAAGYIENCFKTGLNFFFYKFFFFFLSWLLLNLNICKNGRQEKAVCAREGRIPPFLVTHSFAKRIV